MPTKIKIKVQIHLTENKLRKKQIVKYNDETDILVHYQWYNTSQNFIYNKFNK